MGLAQNKALDMNPEGCTKVNGMPMARQQPEERLPCTSPTILLTAPNARREDRQVQLFG